LRTCSGSAAGKKRMRQFGKVEIRQEAFIAALKVDV
jgi:translation elongation factor EF-4